MLVTIEGLVKRFGDFVAVDNIDLNIKEGEIFGLLGPNGAGKSTTINILCGLLDKNNGKINIFHKDLDKNREYIKGNLGVVPQDIAIYEDLTVYENVRFFGSLYGLKGKELKERVYETLEFVGLGDKAKSFPKSFSGGMKRRLNIACAIVHRPKLIIMDEPTVGIDPQSRNHILQSVRHLNKLGSTIIYTTHYMEEVESICSKIAIMDHGKVIAEGTKEELKALVTDRSTTTIKVENIENSHIEDLKKVKGVIDVRLENHNVLIIDSKRETENLDKIMEFIISHGISISQIESKVPDLETVFLTLTGRKLRD